MERSGFGGLIVVDSARHLLGYVELADVTPQRDNTTLDRACFKPLPSATPDAKLSDLIQLLTVEGSPVVILDSRQRSIGVVDKSTVLAALAQGDNSSSDSNGATRSAESGEAVPEAPAATGEVPASDAGAQ